MSMKVFLKISAVVCGIMLVFMVGTACKHRHELSKRYHRSDPIDVSSTSSIRQYCRANGLSTSHCIIVDFSRPSGRDRMRIVNLQTGETVSSGPCAHGQGKGNTARQPKFSNVLGSGCSSVGRFEVGMMEWHNRLGRIFRVKGYDETNSHAQMRGIYIHSSRRVRRMPENNPYLELSKASEGCFTTDRRMLNEVERAVKNSRLPLLLLAYEDPDIFHHRHVSSLLSSL